MEINPTRFRVMKTNIILWVALSLIALTGCDIIKQLTDPEERSYRKAMAAQESFGKTTFERLNDKANSAHPGVLCVQGQARINDYRSIKTRHPDKKEEIDQKINQWESILSERCD